MIRKFIEKLQNADEARKKRWLIGLSAAAMILIVGLWVIYLNFVLDKIGEPKQEAPSAPSGAGFWQVMRTGAGKAINYITGIIGTERTITIE